MKKVGLFIVVSVMLFSCQPKDKQAPLIFIKGDNPMTIFLGKWFKDPGATAEDNKDKDISAKIIMTHNVPINGPSNGEGTTNLVDTSCYMTYSCKDAAGNQATATRKVNVINQIHYFATRYEMTVNANNGHIVHDTTISSINLTVDNRTNMKMWFPKLGGKNGLRIYAIVVYDREHNLFYDSVPDQKIPLYDGINRYLYGVMGIPSQSKIYDTIDPSIDVKYYLTKYRKSTSGTIIWPVDCPDSLWEVVNDDIVLDHYERF